VLCFLLKRRVGVALHGSSFRSCACLSASLCVYIHLCRDLLFPTRTLERGGQSFSLLLIFHRSPPTCFPSTCSPLPWPYLPFPLGHNTTQHNTAQRPTSTQTPLSLDRPHARHGHEYRHKDEVIHAPLPSFPFLSAPRHDTSNAARRGYSEGRRHAFRFASFRFVLHPCEEREPEQSGAE
jgi:hypothetical protein